MNNELLPLSIFMILNFCFYFFYLFLLKEKKTQIFNLGIGFIFKN